MMPEETLARSDCGSVSVALSAWTIEPQPALSCAVFEGSSLSLALSAPSDHTDTGNSCHSRFKRPANAAESDQCPAIRGQSVDSEDHILCCGLPHEIRWQG